MIKFIIFDLDNCILNTRAMPKEVLAPLLQALEVSEISEEARECFLKNMWHMPLLETFAKCNLPESVVQDITEVYENLAVPKGVKLTTYGDEHHILEIEVKKALVTTGIPSFQESKITALGIEEWFEFVRINDTAYTNSFDGKKAIFSELMDEQELMSREVMVVGDSGPHELRAGKALGMRTVQTIRPEVVPWDAADYQISDFSELEAIIKKEQLQS